MKRKRVLGLTCSLSLLAAGCSMASRPATPPPPTGGARRLPGGVANLGNLEALCRASATPERCAYPAPASESIYRMQVRSLEELLRAEAGAAVCRVIEDSTLRVVRCDTLEPDLYRMVRRAPLPIARRYALRRPPAQCATCGGQG
jgi:hypothetical protein